MTKIETLEHLRTYATERLSAELADRDEDMPPRGGGREEAVSEWLMRHPEVTVGTEVAS